MQLKLIILTAMAAFVLFPARASAQLYCGNGGFFSGSVTVSATSLTFGIYDPSLVTPDTSNMTVTVACRGSFFFFTVPPFTATLSTGTSGSYTNRKMSSAGSDRLLYQIYNSATYTTVWGDGTGGTSAVSGGGNNQSSVSLSGYGYLTSHQYVTPGFYSDSLVVSITY